MKKRFRVVSLFLAVSLLSAALLAAGPAASAISAHDFTPPSWESDLFDGDHVSADGFTELDDLRTDYMTNPLGIDAEAPAFSWRMVSDIVGQRQTAYRVWVAADEAFTDVVWDSGAVLSDQSMGVHYAGAPLTASTKYFWRVEATDAFGARVPSGVATFETGLLSTTQAGWPEGIQWIGNPNTPVSNTGAWNPNAVSVYAISFNFRVLDEGSRAFSVVYAARNKVTYIEARVDLSGPPALTVTEWVEGVPTIRAATDLTGVIPDTPDGKADTYALRITQTSTTRSSVVISKGSASATGSVTMSSTPSNAPRRWYMGNFGFNALDAAVTLDTLRITNNSTLTYLSDDFADPHSMAGTLGEVSDGALTIRDTYAQRRVVPTTTLRRAFAVNPAKQIESARLYASARGIYETFLNGQRVTDTYFNPNFTEFDMRIMYQTFDVTDLLRPGENAIGAYVSRGWYADYSGYSGAQRSGMTGDMLAFVRVVYTDGTSEVVVKTDETWSFTPNSPILNGSLMDGEIYDATLEQEGWAEPGFDGPGWGPAGVKNAPNYTARVSFRNNNNQNGYFWNLNPTFQLSAQKGPLAAVERVLPALNLDDPKVNVPGEDPRFPGGLTAYAYDLGQNMVGVPRVTVRGVRGTELEITGAEIAYQNGTPYNANYRSAYNTTSYTLRGDPEGEVYSPLFTFNGFRYIILRVPSGQEMPEVLGVEGLVLTNTPNITGDFNSSNGLLNQLQSNIQWGQRGNYLLVPTDCPQRNERMGWTADTQVFSTTAAYNVDVVAFLQKWLQDMRDSQVYYNQWGAVPDTAPLGGDNRGSQYGCSGWSDAGVLIPWNLYQATGDIQFLIDSYDLMLDQVKYRGTAGISSSRDTVTDVAGSATPAVAAASDAWLVKQQRRGDHLGYDATTPWILSGTAYAARICDLMARAAALLGRPDDAALAADYFGRFKKGFNDKYVLEDGSIHYMGETGSAYTTTMYNEKWGGQVLSAGGARQNADYFGNPIPSTHYGEPEHALDAWAVQNDRLAPPSQTAYALAIAFELLPEDKRAAAGRFLVKAIERRGGDLSVGFHGIAWINPALSMTGHDDVAYSLLFNERLPGWMYTVLQGGTTFWERWNSYTAETDTMGPVDMNSFNHYAYGAIGYWIYAYGMGLQIDERNPGYKHVVVEPHVGGDLAYATTYHDSAYGRMESGWKASGNNMYVYSVAVPANTTATLYLPVDAAAFVPVPGVTYVGQVERLGRTVAQFELTSGGFTFYLPQAILQYARTFDEADAAPEAWAVFADALAAAETGEMVAAQSGRYEYAGDAYDALAAAILGLTDNAWGGALTELTVDRTQKAVTVEGAGYTPYQTVPLFAAYDREATPSAHDYSAGVRADGDGNVRFTLPASVTAGRLGGQRCYVALGAGAAVAAPVPALDVRAHSSARISLRIKGKAPLNLRVDALPDVYTVTSSNPAVASAALVNGAWVVTGHRAGTALIAVRVAEEFGGGAHLVTVSVA
ncbi:MAG: glycoside hydrolase family 78 protein [Oscillospiraceae bacterium]|jgi:alpha-L-rhamnosidase|nr:glycoside hydrolase family 78 protein [Oscillospiraceae bacterium]